MSEPTFVQLFDVDDTAAAAELRAGLVAQPHAHIAPKFLYDALGSRLFEAITELPEYYPTRVEASILERHRDAIAEATGRGRVLVDLGAGNCEKAARLFDALAPSRYVAVDISADFVRDALLRLQLRYPRVPMAGVGLDFAAALPLPDALLGSGPRLLFYPGSSIGNFTPDEARAFLRRVRERCGAGGGLLVGVDLVKPREVLEPAYDDALGVTAAFNLNLLLHLNRRIGADFAPRDWQHVGLWNAPASRIEMHLQARRALRVRWAGGERDFAAGERIHTENSYKYLLGDFEALLREAGFARTQHWTDPQGWFAVVHAAS